MFCSQKTFTLNICLLVCLACSFLPGQLIAQENFHYDGAYKLGNYRGEASYDFQMVEQDTILNGSFELKRSNPAALLTGEDAYFSFTGKFNNDIPTGNWEFNFGRFEAAEGQSVQDYQYRINVNGTHQQAAGNILKGRPDGEWKHSIYTVENGEVSQELFNSTLNFKEGIPQRNFQIQSKNYTLVGRFLREGLAHDNWELYSSESTDALEIWHFQEGRLEKITLQEEGGTRQIELYADKSRKTQIINLDDQYLNIIRLTQQLETDSMAKIDGKMYMLLEENSQQYRKVSNILSEFVEADFMPSFKVKVAYYPLSDEENKQLDSIENLNKIAQQRVAGILKNTQLNLMRFTDLDVSFQLKTLEHLQLHHLQFIQKLLDYRERGVLAFVPHEKLVQKLWPNESFLGPLEISYEVGDSLVTQNFNGPALPNQREGASGIDALYQLTEYAYWSVDLLKQKLDDKLQKEQRQQELMELENELILVSKRLNIQIDSLQNKVKGKPEQSLKSIKSAVKEALGAYSAMSDLSMKQEQAQDAIDCFKKMEQLSLQIVQIPSRGQELKTLYTDEVWNPFTATVMSEKVKKRVLTAYEEVLIPFILEEINENLSCANAEELNNLLSRLNNRMIALREEDTDKLERKLKKESDPEAVIRLLELNTNPEKAEQ